MSLQDRLLKAQKSLKNLHSALSCYVGNDIELTELMPEVRSLHNRINSLRWHLGELAADEATFTGRFTTIEELTKHLNKE